ncbi:MAG: nitroreductase family protein [Caldilineaceae bacterium]|nr:nitroreductase family protein [Caldilineaceae bacterium]HRJ44785.1 nitroreductase family protein [Caldilineaceae bacterium]
MDVFDAVRTVLAVRAYQDKAVPREIIHRIVEAGRLTGSSMNGQPWHFIVVEKRETLRQLGGLARSGPYTADAAFAVVVATEPSRFAVSDGSRAIQSMMLVAWAEGIGSNWVGFQGMDEVKRLLNIPDSFDVLAIVPFGYPARKVGRGRKKRKSLVQVAHRERFGQPLGEG